MFLDKARRDPNPETAIGHIGASLPPAIIMSASPLLMSSRPFPIASAPLEQEDTKQRFVPKAFASIETCAEAVSPNIMGIKNGETRRGPRVSRISCCMDSVNMPPIPLPIKTPVL